jgi:hypothetical protein
MAKIIKVEGQKRIVIYAMRDIAASEYIHTGLNARKIDFSFANGLGL